MIGRCSRTDGSETCKPTGTAWAPDYGKLARRQALHGTGLWETCRPTGTGHRIMGNLQANRHWAPNYGKLAGRQALSTGLWETCRPTCTGHRIMGSNNSCNSLFMLNY